MKLAVRRQKGIAARRPCTPEARYHPSRAGLLAVRCELHVRSVRLTLKNQHPEINSKTGAQRQQNASHQLCTMYRPCYPKGMLEPFYDFFEHVASWWRLHHSAWLLCALVLLCGGVIGIARAYGVRRQRWLLWVGAVALLVLVTTAMATFIMYYTAVLRHPLWFVVVALSAFAALISNLRGALPPRDKR